MMQNMKDCLKVKEGVYKAGVTVSECHNSSTCHFFFSQNIQLSLQDNISRSHATQGN